MSATVTDIFGSAALAAQAIAAASGFIGVFRDETAVQIRSANAQVDPTQTDPTAASSDADAKRRRRFVVCLLFVVIGIVCSLVTLILMLTS